MKDYLYIRAWGAMMHSYPTYIKDQVQLARQHKAPADAIYYDLTKRCWHRWSEMKDSNPNKAYVQSFVDELKG